MKPTRWSLILLAMLSIGLPAARGQSAEFNGIQQALESHQPEQLKQAIPRIIDLLAAQPRLTMERLADGWLKVYFDAGEFDAAQDLSLRAILADAGDTRRIEALLDLRIHALLKLNKVPEALQAAKGLYNVSTMETMTRTQLVVAECFNAAHPDDVNFADQYREEQSQGMEYTAATQPASTAATRPLDLKTADGRFLPPIPDQAEARRSGLLGAVHVDAAPFGKAIHDADPENFVLHNNALRNETALGNLLLLADHPEQALEVFTAALANADNDNRLMANENIARAIKAEDGTVGRANAWIRALRSVYHRAE